MLQFGWLNEKEEFDTRYEIWSDPVTDSELSRYLDPSYILWRFGSADMAGHILYLVVCSSFISSWGAGGEWLLKLSKH